MPGIANRGLPLLGSQPLSLVCQALYAPDGCHIFPAGCRVALNYRYSWNLLPLSCKFAPASIRHQRTSGFRHSQHER